MRKHPFDDVLRSPQQPDEDQKLFWELTSEPDINSAIVSVYRELERCGYTTDRWGDALRSVFEFLDEIHLEELRSKGKLIE